MKRRIITLLILIGIQFTFAQKFGENNAIYTTQELNLGNYVGLDVSFNYVYQERYSFKMSYTGNIRKPKSQPNDYITGFTGLLFFGLLSPYDHLKNFQIGVGRIYKLNEKGTIRLNATMGLGYTTIEEPTNWQKVTDSFWTENYTWEYQKNTTVSLILSPKIEFAFTRFYGLSISPMLQINKDRIYFGIGFGQMLGLLRSKKNKTNISTDESL